MEPVMTTTEPDGAAAAPFGQQQATRAAARRFRARWLWGWFTDTGYRPERHYMRGGRTHGAMSLRPRPA
jgi:hypothetical protein